MLFATYQASPVKASCAARRRCWRWIRRWMIERSMGETSTASGSPLHGPNLTAAGKHPTQRFETLTEIARPLQGGEPIFLHSPRCERSRLDAQATNPHADVPSLRLMWRQYGSTITGVITLNIITSITANKVTTNPEPLPVNGPCAGG